MKTKQKVVEEKRAAFIKVSEIDEGGIIRAIEYGYKVCFTETPNEDGFYSYFIPAFNIHFFAKNEDDADKISNSVMTTFFNYWVKNQGKKAFFDEIKRLGFVEVKTKAASPKKNIRFSVLKPSIPPAFNKGKYTSSKMAAIAA